MFAVNSEGVEYVAEGRLDQAVVAHRGTGHIGHNQADLGH